MSENIITEFIGTSASASLYTYTLDDLVLAGLINKEELEDLPPDILLRIRLDFVDIEGDEGGLDSGSIENFLDGLEGRA